jgi:hypothetical protein
MVSWSGKVNGAVRRYNRDLPADYMKLTLQWQASPALWRRSEAMVPSAQENEFHGNRSFVAMICPKGASPEDAFCFFQPVITLCLIAAATALL